MRTMEIRKRKCFCIRPMDDHQKFPTHTLDFRIYVRRIKNEIESYERCWCKTFSFAQAGITVKVQQSKKKKQRRVFCTLGGMCGVSKRNSCMIHPVLIPFGARFLQNTNVFLIPTISRVAGSCTVRSFPVAFQYPDVVARLVRNPVAYLRSRKLKKYHSLALSLATSVGPHHKSSTKK